jgi:hypothetical protein
MNGICIRIVRLALTMAAGLGVTAAAAAVCEGPRVVREATLTSIKAFVDDRRMAVLTFTGFSGGRYEDPEAMLRHAARILAAQDPARTLVNVGATAEGIGAVYALARRSGFTTMGIVSTLARDEAVALSECVDYVFFVRDGTWGGRVPGSDRLSPTSEAIVAVSSSMVGIGGGEVARDEMLEARRRGTPVTFISADMNHRFARERARRAGRDDPVDFRGAAEAALAPGSR